MLNYMIKMKKKKHIKRFCSSLIVAGAVSVPTLAQNVSMAETQQESKVYSLDECIAEAMKNNLTLRNADNQVAMSAEQRKEAFTKYFPTVSATGGGFISNQGLMQMELGGMGMSLAKNGLVGGVTAMQPVFAGGQIANGNKLAKVGEDVSRLQRNMSENEVRLSAEQYYWNIVMLKEKLHTLDQVEKQLVRVEADAQAAVDAGIRNRNDLLQVQLRKNETRTSRIQVENAVATVRDLLAQVMGHAGEAIDIDCNITGGTKASADLSSDGKQQASCDLPDSPQQYFQSPESSLPQTNEYQLLEKQIEANKLQYKLSVGKNLPTVAVGGGYLYNNIMDKSQSNLMGMFTVSVPISSWWGGSHDMKRQKLQVANSENEKRDKGELLMVKMRKAWNDMNDAYRQVAIARESIAQSEENLRLNTDYYQAGTATISDLLDAQTLYQQSRDKYVESFTNYEVKKREYLQATGR